MFNSSEYIKKVYSLDYLFGFVNENFNDFGKEYESNHYFFRGQSNYS